MEVVSKIVMKNISEVKPYVRNPRKNDKTIDLLVEVIPKVGFNVPLVIDHKGVIVKGHARYAAAIRLGLKQIPCVVTDADEETIKLDRLTDNKISEFSEWVNDDLLHELDMLNLGFDFNLADLGFPSLDSFSLDDLWSTEDDGEPDQESEEARRARYAAYLEQTAQEEDKNAVITTQEQIDKAKASAAEIAEKPAKYFKVICEQCGKIMFIKEGDAVFLAE